MASHSASSNSKAEEYKALYQAYLERCNAHDFEGMKAFYKSPLNVMDKTFRPRRRSRSVQASGGSIP
jgi:ketosteroid isomerase-like protein